MSKSLKSVIGIAASIIVPYAAPIVSTAIGLSGAIGSIAGSAVTGAALGGVSQAALGGDWKKGALFGAIGGGIGGYLNPGGTMPEFMGGPGWGAGGPGAAGGAGGAGGAGSAGATNLATAGTTAPTAPPLGVSGGTVQAAGVQPSGAITAGEVAPQSLGQSLKNALVNAPKAIAQKVSDPKFLADLTLKAGMMLGGQMLAGDMAAMAPEEQMLLKAQMEDLALVRQQNRDLYNFKMNEAQKFLNRAEAFDPIEMGRQAARQEQTRAGLAIREQTSGIRDDARRMAEQRRGALQASKNVGTAFEQGQAKGVDAQTQYTQAGMGMLPTPTSGASYAGLMQDYGTMYNRQNEAFKNIGGFFGSLMNDKSTGQKQGTQQTQGMSEQYSPYAGLYMPE